MTTPLVDRVVAATLYEGYILYPYRATSVKNQMRWTFGGVFPQAYSDATRGSERASVLTECLLRGGAATRVEITARFLHPARRTVLQLLQPAVVLDAAALTSASSVRELTVDGVRHLSWEEATERSLDTVQGSLDDLVRQPRIVRVRLDAEQSVEPIADAGGRVLGAIRRVWQPLEIEVAVSAAWCDAGIARISVRVSNLTGVDATELDRDRALLQSLVSTHVVLRARDGTWLSLADPPQDHAAAAGACSNDGLWPVLIDDDAGVSTVLASPIILEDNPQLADESPGDLFDATEIDEILSLRILTLTDSEKEEMRAADARSAALLDRTEALTQEQFMRMHGTIRELRPAERGG